MIPLQQKTIANYVTENIKTADVFNKYGIDFCCSGHMTIEKVCIEKNINQIILEKELSEVDAIRDLIEDYDKWELQFLMIYIETIHHTYIKESLPIISQYANKVAKVHGTKQEGFIILNELFYEVANELLSHLQKEEQILFPFIKQLITAKKEGKKMMTTPFKTIDNPICMMEYEHKNVRNIFKEISRLTNNYTPSTDACSSLKVLYYKLKEFEQDLYYHFHLENNILHPKAIELEKEVLH
ncbi:DUF542 domain-containing protein [Tenacibaculum tangerinum]|uniref:DUF542 domain-containing protein n=1 Tax=Tenacibaculum tangerinum TaxID=3038772 RepID=A0ABY8L824_9FLAO|nr:DUF542 domain-containing protein [Tenacibaculum tangerinum]WGH76115.1 DUF542 domain-containing protein [Tenacibaculum tangerinum]